jgi:hypothetical protein
MELRVVLDRAWSSILQAPRTMAPLHKVSRGNLLSWKGKTVASEEWG